MIQDKKQQELNSLKKRCFIFFDYFYDKYGQLEIYKNAKIGIEKEFKNENLTGLRHASKDLNNWLREMSLKDALELGEILKRELNEDVTLIEKKRFKMIQNIIKKGSISNDDEFRVLQERVDELSQTDKKSTEIKTLNTMLNTYDKEHKST